MATPSKPPPKSLKSSSTESPSAWTRGKKSSTRSTPPASRAGIRLSRDLARAHRSHQGLYAPLPIRKQVDILRLPLDRARHSAGVQPHGKHEDLVQRHPPCAVQCIADLRLKASPLRHRLPREAGHEKIRPFNRRFDGPRPILSREQLPHIHPRFEPRRCQSVE